MVKVLQSKKYEIKDEQRRDRVCLLLLLEKLQGNAFQHHQNDPLVLLNWHYKLLLYSEGRHQNKLKAPLRNQEDHHVHVFIGNILAVKVDGAVNT